MLPEIHKTFDMPASSPEARDKLAEVQGQLCGVLQVSAGTAGASGRGDWSAGAGERPQGWAFKPRPFRL